MAAALARSLGEVRENVAAAGAAGLVQPMLFNPLECLRVRWQVSHGAGGMLAFTTELLGREGLLGGLWLPGLPQNMLAVALSQGLRLGLYPACRDLVLSLRHGSGDAAEPPQKTPGVMLATGLVSGSVAYLVAAPAYLAKTRLQAEAQFASGGGGASVVAVTAGGGPLAYWRGCGPLVARGALLTSGQMLGYDGTKTLGVRDFGLRDGPALHVLAATLAGLCAATFAAPADVLVTRYQCTDAGGRAHSGVLSCAASLAREGGPAVFFRGWTASFLRLAPTFMVGSVIYEQARRALGLSYMT